MTPINRLRWDWRQGAGIGLVIDQGGDDTYRLAPGTGGVGLAGLGILYDGDGQDIYEGSRFTQVRRSADSASLVDHAGDDRYTSYGYALGFGDRWVLAP